MIFGPHIALVPRMAQQIHGVEKRTTLEGFDFGSFVGALIAEEQTQRSKSQIIALLTAEGEPLAKWLEGLTDDFLAQRVTFPQGMVPPSKTRFEMLLGLKEHEMHHRGQLMLIERMVGVVPHLTVQMNERIAAMQAAAAAKAGS